MNSIENTDKLIIKDAKFLAHIGVTEKERKKKQPIFVDLELFLCTIKAGTTGNIEDSVDYSAVHGTIKKIVETKQHILIETLAEEISENVLAQYPKIHKIKIKIKKPNALAKENVKYAGIDILREKGGKN